MKKLTISRSVGSESLIIMIFVIFIAGCNSNVKTDKPITNQNTVVPNDYFVYAAIYNYYTSEYKALAYQAFNAASDHLELLKIKNPGIKDMAVVVDIDETILDNSPYQARLFEINAGYDSLWNDWCDLVAARPIPGAVEFLSLADSMGYEVFYISNRKLKNVYASTLKNLHDAGFPMVDTLHLLLRDSSNSKESRRMKVEENYQIVMLVGDNIGDFYEDTEDFQQRESTVSANRTQKERKMIVLPNAMYGNWTGSLGIQNKNDIDSLINLMTLPFKK